MTGGKKKEKARGENVTAELVNYGDFILINKRRREQNNFFSKKITSFL
jgi:hypothetical protein